MGLSNKMLVIWQKIKNGHMGCKSNFITFKTFALSIWEFFEKPNQTL